MSEKRVKRDQEADVKLAAIALPIAAAFRKDGDAWYVMAPTDQVAAAIERGAFSTITSDGRTVYRAVTNGYVVSGQTDITFDAFTDDADGNEVRVNVTTFQAASLNLPRDEGKVRHGFTYRLSEKRAAATTKRVDADEYAAFLAFRAGKAGATSKTSEATNVPAATVVKSSGAKPAAKPRGKGAAAKVAPTLPMVAADPIASLLNI